MEMKRGFDHEESENKWRTKSPFGEGGYRADSPRQRRASLLSRSDEEDWCDGSQFLQLLASPLVSPAPSGRDSVSPTVSFAAVNRRFLQATPEEKRRIHRVLEAALAMRRRRCERKEALRRQAEEGTGTKKSGEESDEEPPPHHSGPRSRRPMGRNLTPRASCRGRPKPRPRITSASGSGGCSRPRSRRRKCGSQRHSPRTTRAQRGMNSRSRRKSSGSAVHLGSSISSGSTKGSSTISSSGSTKGSSTSSSRGSGSSNSSGEDPRRQPNPAEAQPDRAEERPDKADGWPDKANVTPDTRGYPNAAKGPRAPKEEKCPALGEEETRAAEEAAGSGRQWSDA
ncbi:GL20668 [Drosophila persimilis]|uniref:GL20668 n=1 Tax=Drosophila persimilis TaxID=7234 RepID=B4H9Z5_DROPE|nr:GL20668 [Drosophila persimilis]